MDYDECADYANVEYTNYINVEYAKYTDDAPQPRMNGHGWRGVSFGLGG